MIQRSRVPAIITLVVLFGCFMAFMAARRTSADEGQLSTLQAAVNQPNAKPEAWLAYAKKLQTVGDFEQAGAAFERYLKSFPSERDALLSCCMCKARSGKSDDFYAFMERTVKVDPRLAKAVLEDSVVSRFMSEERFKGLYEEAKAGSMD